MTILFWKPGSLHDAYEHLFGAGSLVVCSETFLDDQSELSEAVEYLRCAALVPTDYEPSLRTLGSSDFPLSAFPERRLIHFGAACAGDARLLAHERLGGMYQILLSRPELAIGIPTIVAGFAAEDGERSMVEAAERLVRPGGFVGLFHVCGTESLDELCVVTSDPNVSALLIGLVEKMGETVFSSWQAYQQKRYSHPGICEVEILPLPI